MERSVQEARRKWQKDVNYRRVIVGGDIRGRWYTRFTVLVAPPGTTYYCDEDLLVVAQ